MTTLAQTTTLPNRSMARPAPVLNLQRIGMPGSRLSLQAEVGDIVLIDGFAPAATWRVLAIAAGYAFGGPGRCEIGGFDTAALSAQQRAALRSRLVAQAMQRDELDDQHSLLHNATRGALERGVPAAKARQQALHALEATGLLRWQDEPVAGLARAQRRLGVLARALACHAPLLVLEQPETDLDEAQITLLRDALWLAAFDSRSCVLMSTGHPSLASLAQRRIGHVGAGGAGSASGPVRS